MIYKATCAIFEPIQNSDLASHSKNIRIILSRTLASHIEDALAKCSSIRAC